MSSFCNKTSEHPLLVYDVGLYIEINIHDWLDVQFMKLEV